MNHACFCHGGCHGGYKLQFDFSKSTKEGSTRKSPRPNAKRRKKSGEEEPRALGSTWLSIRFRGVSARYTSFNRIRMQCCGKFHLSEARGSEWAGWGRGVGGRKGHARESGSRCDFVSTLRTPSRVLHSPFRHDTFAYPPLAFALVRKCNRGTERVTMIESFYDAANRGIMIARCSSPNVIDKAIGHWESFIESSSVLF